MIALTLDSSAKVSIRLTDNRENTWLIDIWKRISYKLLRIAREPDYTGQDGSATQ